MFRSWAGLLSLDVVALELKVIHLETLLAAIAAQFYAIQGEPPASLMSFQSGQRLIIGFFFLRVALGGVLIWHNVTPKFLYDLERGAAVRKGSETVALVHSWLLNFDRLYHTQGFWLGQFCDVSDWDCDFFVHPHQAGVKADIVFCEVHPPMLQDTASVSASEVVKDVFLLG